MTTALHRDADTIPKGRRWWLLDFEDFAKTWPGRHTPECAMQRYAIHEGGHFVAGAIQNLTTDGAVIGETLGGRAYVANVADALNHPIESAIMLLAGGAAQSRFTGQDARDCESIPDRAEARSMLEHAYNGDRVAVDVVGFPRCRRLAMELVSKSLYWSGVVCCANALIQARGYVSDAELRRIVSAVCPLPRPPSKDSRVQVTSSSWEETRRRREIAARL